MIIIILSDEQTLKRDVLEGGSNDGTPEKKKAVFRWTDLPTLTEQTSEFNEHLFNRILKEMWGGVWRDRELAH